MTIIAFLFVASPFLLVFGYAVYRAWQIAQIEQTAKRWTSLGDPPQSIIASIPYESYAAMQGKRTLALMQEIDREIEARNRQPQHEYVTDTGMVIAYPEGDA